MVRRVSVVGKNLKFSQAVIEGWRKGDVWAVHDGLDLLPCEYSPVPRKFGAYGLPDAQPEGATLMALTWPKIREIQDELRRNFGEPGSESGRTK